MSVDSRELTNKGLAVWILRVCILCSLPMLALPVPEGYDIAQHLRFAETYQEAIRDGNLTATWAGIDNEGFGSVGVRVYPPLADYTLAITQFVTNDWYETLLINAFFWMIPGCIGVFLWIGDFRGPRTALLAAVLYSVMPYHLLQVYRMQLYSEFVAAAILPFCFLFATRLASRGSAGNIIGFAASCSLLILTHIPASIIGGIGLFVYVAILIDRRDIFNALGRFAVATIAALAGASFYLVRLFLEVDWVRHSNPEYSSGFFSADRFLFPIFMTFGDGYSEYSLWRLDLAILLVLLCVFSLLALILRNGPIEDSRGPSRKVLFALFGTGLMSVVMLSVVSEPLWSSVALFQKLQFSFRFLGIGSLIGAVSLALVISHMSEEKTRASQLILGVAVLVIVGIAAFDLTKIVFGGSPMTREDFYITMVDNRAAPGCECWWPVWSNKKALGNRERASSGERSVEVLQWKNDVRTVRVGPGASDELRLGTFYYPYWKATVNGKAVSVAPDDDGAIRVPISKGESEVNVFFREPAIYDAARSLSLVTWICLLMWAIYLKRKSTSDYAYPADA